MNKFKRELIILVILFFVTSAISIYFYGEMKENGVERVPIHWNIQNEPDNFASPVVACLFGPLAIVFIMIATIAMGRKTYSKPEKKSTRFVILLIAAFLVFINWIALKSALGYSTNKGFDLSMMFLGFGLVFILIGNQFGKIPRSMWVGIRVPATLMNDEVWNRVHRIGGKLMVVSGIFIIPAAFIQNSKIAIFFFIPLFISMILIILIIPEIVKKKVEMEEKDKKNK